LTAIFNRSPPLPAGEAGRLGSEAVCRPAKQAGWGAKQVVLPATQAGEKPKGYCYQKAITTNK